MDIRNWFNFSGMTIREIMTRVAAKAHGEGLEPGHEIVAKITELSEHGVDLGDYVVTVTRTR